MTGFISPGEVTAVLDGDDGQAGTVYDVDYGEEGCFHIDHLLEDLQTGDLTFI